MQGYAVAMRLKARYQDFIDTIGIHPTTSEELVKNKPSKDEDENPQAGGC